MNFSSQSPGRRAGAVLTVLLVLLFGQRVGEGLVVAVGGSNTAAPYSSLAFTDPESASSVAVGSYVEFRISNQTGNTKRYEWVASIDGRTVDRGSVRIKASQSSVELAETKQRGKLVISLLDSSIKITGKVVSVSQSRENAGQR